MSKLIRALALFFVLPTFSVETIAKSKHKSTHKVSSQKVHEPGKKIVGKARPDLEARALVRKSAPFSLEERHRGHTLRINKDGTFSVEGELRAHATEGRWKVGAGRFKLIWSSGEEYSYPLTFNGKTPLLVGRKATTKGRYVLNSAD